MRSKWLAFYVSAGQAQVALTVNSKLNKSMLNGAGHEKTEAVLGLSWSTSCFSHPFHSSGFCIQGSTSWNQRRKLLAWSHLSNKIKIKLKTALHINCLLFIGLNVHHAIFSVTDWKTARRVKSSFVEHAEISWKPPGTSNENRTHHWHYFPHCKYRFSNLYDIITYSILIILILTNLCWFKLCTKQEGIAVGRTFAALKNYQVDGNKEMIAIGVMNIVGSSTSCYITTGAISTSYAFLRSGNNSRR